MGVNSRNGMLPNDLRELENILSQSNSLESWDSSMLGQASPSLRRHLDPARANVLRFLSLDKSMRVLEIGAEAGALTRYLGEKTHTVIALEPNDALANLTRLRTRDLESVQVIAGEVTALPNNTRYDVIVAVDGLRMAQGAPARQELLRQLIDRLTPEGSLVLAEANKFGLKSLLGSPDDLTGRVFDSIEDYPFGEPHGALTRSEIDGLLGEAGTRRSYFLTLPDHTYSRSVVRTEGLPEELKALSSELSILPSPDLAGVRPKLSDERRVWPAIVTAGLEVELANSWLVVVTLGAKSAILDDDVFASFDGWQRAAKYTPHTVIRSKDSQIVVDRKYPNRSSADPLGVYDSIEPFAVGRNLLAVMVETPFDEMATLLSGWRTAVEASSSDRLWLDAHPGNFIVQTDGSIHAIDLEFASTNYDLDFVLRRGLISLARDLAIRRLPSSWPDTVLRIDQAAVFLGEFLGYNPDSGWFVQTLRQEAGFQAEVAGERSAQVSEDERFEALRAQFDTLIANLPLGPRVFDHFEESIKDRDAVAAERNAIRGELQQTLRELTERNQQLSERSAELSKRSAELSELREEQTMLSSRIQSLETELALVLESSETTKVRLESAVELLTIDNNQMHHLLDSRSVRAALQLRKVFAWLLPSGSRRRRFFAKLTSRSRKVKEVAEHPTDFE